MFLNPTQYSPLDKLKIYQNDSLVSNLVRKFNFNEDFNIAVNTVSNSFDIALSDGLHAISDLQITNPLVKQTLRYDGTFFVNDYLSLDDLLDVVVANPSDKHVLMHNGTNWSNILPILDDINDVVISNPLLDQILFYNGNNWANAYLTLNSLSDVITNTPLAKQVIRYNGTNFVNSFLVLDDIGDVAITSPSATQTLRHNGTFWANSKLALTDLSDISFTGPVLKKVIRHDGTNWKDAFLTLNDISNVVISNPVSEQVIKYDGANFINASVAAVALNGLSDVTITTPALPQVLKYNGAGLWINSQLAIDDMSDVVVSSPLLNHVVRHNGSYFENSYFYLDFLQDVSILNPITGDTLRYNGSIFANQPLALSDLSDIIYGTPDIAYVPRWNGTHFESSLLSLDDLSGCALLNPAVKEVLRYNGTFFENALLSADDLGDVIIISPSIGHIMKWNGNNFENTFLNLDDLGDLTISGAALTQVIRYNGSTWVNAFLVLNDMLDVTISSPANKHALIHNGSNWENRQLSLNDLTNVVITSPQTDDVIQYNGTNFVNTPASSSGGVRLPDDTIAPTTGRWGSFWGGALNGNGMLGFDHIYDSSDGETISSTESVSEIYTAATAGDYAQFKTARGFRRDSNCIFKFKWKTTSSSSNNVKIGLIDAAALPSGFTLSYGSLTTRYDRSQNSSNHLEFGDGNSISRASIRFDSGAAIGEVVREVIVRFRTYGNPQSVSTTAPTVTIRKGTDDSIAYSKWWDVTPFPTDSGEETETVDMSDNTYVMVAGDRVCIEYPASSTDGIELDQTTTSTTGFSSWYWEGSSWSNGAQLGGEHLGMRIRTVSVNLTQLGNQPLNNQNGIMVHGTTGTHTNYQIARNNGSATQTVQDSGKTLANVSYHTVELQLNGSTNVKVIIDGTTFTYTTILPSTTTAMAFFLHLETTSAAVRGLGISYVQVVMD